jgi:aromatic ring-opening dioxygenase LigB subunit
MGIVYFKRGNPKEKRKMMIKMNHFYSDEWYTDERKRTQEELQNIAKQIRSNCKVTSISPVVSFNDYICTIYENENLGLKYWIKDTFGNISEIDEARYC